MEQRSRLKEYVQVVPRVVALLAVALLPLLPNAFFWAEGNSDLRYCFKVFILPALLFSWWLLNRQRCREKLTFWERVLTVPFLAALVVAVLNGPVLLLNAKLPPQVPVLLEGTVVEKSSPSAKSKARIVFLDRDRVRQRWPVQRSVYDQVQAGDTFRIHALRGGLGILYVDSGTTYWERRPAAGP